jgi:hypothetical protein
MKLHIRQFQEGSAGKIQFVVQSRLELGWQERQLLQRYGAIPLIEPPPPPLYPGATPTPERVLSLEQLAALLTSEGCVYKSTDVRKALAFVERLKATCRELPGYWKDAELFESSHTTDPLEPVPS